MRKTKLNKAELKELRKLSFVKRNAIIQSFLEAVQARKRRKLQ